MRYTDFIAIIFIVSAFLLCFSGTLKTYEKLYKKNSEIIDETSACYFISESFKETCDGRGFKSLCQWQKSCKDMWNLKYIAWCNAKDFLPVPPEYGKKILYGKWIGEKWEGEVYWEVENE